MTAQFPRFLTIEEAAERLGVSVARISMWIGECKLPVAARSEYAGFLLHTLTVETVGCDLASALPPGVRCAPLDEALHRDSSTRDRSECTKLTAVEPNHQRLVHVT